MAPKGFSWINLAACAVLFVHSTYAQTFNPQDRAFLEAAAAHGTLDVQMSQLGEEKSLTSGVKSLSESLIHDYSKTNEQLSIIAKDKGVTLPIGNASIPDDLQSKTGRHFDKAFTEAVVEGHKKAIKEFEKEASSGSDPDVMKWAAETLPTLRNHLDVAKALLELM